MLNVFGSPETSRCYNKANSFFHWIEKVFNFPSCLACQIVFVRFWVLCFVLDLKGLQEKIKLVPLTLGIGLLGTRTKSILKTRLHIHILHCFLKWFQVNY